MRKPRFFKSLNCLLNCSFGKLHQDSDHQVPCTIDAMCTMDSDRFSGQNEGFDRFEKVVGEGLVRYFLALELQMPMFTVFKKFRIIIIRSIRKVDNQVKIQVVIFTIVGNHIGWSHMVLFLNYLIVARVKRCFKRAYH